MLTCHRRDYLIVGKLNYAAEPIIIDLLAPHAGRRQGAKNRNDALQDSVIVTYTS
jgi:hypothetical protein